MPREESIAESAKQRSLRVPLDHYEQPNLLVRAKWKLSLLVGLFAVGYVAWLLLGGRTAREQPSPGPLAAAHATWNDDCLACHQNFQPLRSDALNLAGLFRGQASNRGLVDATCIKCHNTPIHHASASPIEVPTCAACHHDHHGSAADIARPADAQCLGCHRQISLHRNSHSYLNPATADIRGFGPPPSRSASDGTSPDGNQLHPDFRSLEKDPGNIKFNHWLHLQPGLAAADSKQKLRLNDMHRWWQKDYAQYAPAGGLLQLDCGACHQPDDRGGKYMKPIAFEQHCRACHRLELKTDDASPSAEVPHGLSAERLTAFVGGLLLESEQKQQLPGATTDESGKLPLIPGKTLGNSLAQKISQDVLARRATATRGVMAKCLECHFSREGEGSGAGDVPNVVPADVPQVWLRQARFDHRAHRHVECRSCHAAAFAFEQHDKPQFIKPSAGAALARDEQQAMIAGLDNCAQCHAPRRGTAGGARHDCAECHQYHGRDPFFSIPRPALGTHDSPTSFPGSSLRTHDPEAPASLPNLRLVSLNLVSLNKAPENRFVGVSSCASAGCHGDVNHGGPEWKSAFTTWATVDPHAQAFDVLWTVRGREMTRRLERREEPLSDAQHLEAVQRRCVGCHATPPAHGSASASDYSLGVSCESCHGPAGDWLHVHYRANFQRGTAGFIDTRQDLNQRAATCLKCHVGPSDEAGTSQVVDHDLIAAGHPRLAFEFHSYYESKPAHWNRKSIEALVPDAFHFRSWLAGQAKQLEQRQVLIPSAGVADFSQLDCASCHHDLAANSWRQKMHSAILKPIAWPHARLPEPTEPLPIRVRLELVKKLVANDDNGSRWDTALQSYLALRALMADFEGEASLPAQEVVALRAAAAHLGGYLATDCFSIPTKEGRLPTTYDSPSDFAPVALAERMKPVLDALQRLESRLPMP